MSTSYIPAKIATYNSWMSNFSSLLTANPPIYGLTAGDAAAVAAAYARLRNQVRLVQQARRAGRLPPSPTPRPPAMPWSLPVRGYARLVIANNGVSDANKTALASRSATSHPSAVPTPNTSPVLGLIRGPPPAKSR